MRLGLYQCPSPAGDPGRALSRIDEGLRAAAAAGVDMLTMPELFLPGYNAAQVPPPKGLDRALADLPELVARHGVGLTIGLADHAGGGVGNAAFAFDRDGAVLATYHKVQLFGPREQAIFEPGDRLVSFDFEGVRFGLLVCYDVEFPEHTRALARAGVAAILVPTANMHPFVNVHEITVPARALESALTIVYANYCGSEGDLTYTGRALIAGPDGRHLSVARDDTALLWADLPDPSGDGLETPASTQLADYRPVSGVTQAG